MDSTLQHSFDDLFLSPVASLQIIVNSLLVIGGLVAYLVRAKTSRAPTAGISAKIIQRAHFTKNKPVATGRTDLGDVVLGAPTRADMENVQPRLRCRQRGRK